jgi:PXPV repeat-containing protein
MKTVAVLVLAALLLLPGIALADPATDAALGLGAFAVFNQIISGTGIFGGLGAHPVVVAPQPVVVAPPPVVVPPPPVYYAPRPVVVAPAPVYVRPAPVYVHPGPAYGYYRAHVRPVPPGHWKHAGDWRPGRDGRYHR